MKKRFIFGLVVVALLACPVMIRAEQVARQPSALGTAPARERGEAASRLREAEPAVKRLAPALKPNLTIQSLALSRAEVFTGDEVTATVGIACEGAAVADPVRVRFLLGGRALGDETVILRQGMAGKAVFKFTAGVEGSHKLIAHVNPDGKIAELNLRDNQRGTELAVKQRESMQKGGFQARTGAMGTVAVQRAVDSARGGETLADLVVMDLRVDKPAPAAGEEVTATARIQNIGSRDLEGVSARFFLDDRPVGRIVKTDVGASRVVEVEAAFEAGSAGTHEVKVQVDPENRIPELDDQRNNLKTLFLAVTPPRVLGARSGGASPALKGRAVPEGLKALAPRPVLLIRSLAPSKAQVHLGEQLQVEAEIGNQSEEDLGPVRVAFFLGDRQIGAEQQISIPKGATRSASTQFRAEPMGGHLLKVNAFPPAGGRYEKTAALQVTPPMVALSKGEMASGAAIGAAEAVRVAADLPGKPQGPEVAPDGLTPRLTVPVLPGSMESDTTPDEITILSPSGGSAWKIGAPMAIQWKFVPAPKPFHLWLLGNPYDKTAAAIVAQFKTYTPNSQGVYGETWTVPSWVAPGDYYLKIVFVDDPSIYALSGSFKIEAGGPVVIAPGSIYAGPPVKGFEVFRPGFGEVPQPGSPQLVAWQYLPSLLKDPKLYDAVSDAVRIVLLNGQGVQHSVVVPSTSNYHLSQGAYDPAGPVPQRPSSHLWTVPANLPGGTYIVRVETLDGHFFGDSAPFELAAPKKVEQIKEHGKPLLGAGEGGELEKNLEKLIDKNEPLLVEPVQLQAKTLSVTPHFKSDAVWKLDVLVEIDASSQFQLGDIWSADPKLKPFVAMPSIDVRFVMYPTSSSWTPAQDPINGPLGVLSCSGEVIDSIDPEFSWPSGVLNKGKNIVKFTYMKGLNKPYCGPLELRWNTTYGEKTTISCAAQLDAAIKVRLFFRTANNDFFHCQEVWTVLKQPRNYYYDLDHAYPSLPCKTP